MMGSGGGKNTHSTVTQTTTNLPEWVEPYQTALLDRANLQSALPYETYGGQRVADFSPYEQEAMAQMIDFSQAGDNANLTNAINTANTAAGMGLGEVNTNIASGYDPSAMGDAGSYTPTKRDSGYGAGSHSSGYGAGQRSSGYGAGRLGSDAYYKGGSRDVGFDAGQTYGSALDPYKSQYMQDVVDVEKRKAAEQADIRGRDIGLDAAGQGSLGGYREAIMQSQNEKNLREQMGDIQTRGSQAAFENAQQMYQADREARAQRETFDQSQFDMNQQASQKVSELMQQGYTYEQAARQAQEQLGQSQFSMNEQARQMEEDLKRQGFTAEQAAQQVQEQLTQSQFGMNQAADQFGSQMGLVRWQAGEGAAQAAARLGLDADQSNQQAQLQQNQNLLGLQQNRLNASTQQAGLSGQQNADAMERMGIMQGVGGQQRDLAQQSLDTGYADFRQQQSYPYEQLNFLNTMIHGGSIAPGRTSSMFGPEPSNAQQGIGAGLAALGLSGGKGGDG